jgi:hypothetical protein
MDDDGGGDDGNDDDNDDDDDDGDDDDRGGGVVDDDNNVQLATHVWRQGWSVEKAVDYMMEKTGMHREECEAECYRYEAWPGQACA